MKYLLQKTNLNRIKKRIASCDYLFLFLDYDGTLIPIAKNPQLAKLGEETRNILRKLSANKNIILSIVSGRSLKDITKLVRIKNLIYIGNHGFEISIPQLSSQCSNCHSDPDLSGEESRLGISKSISEIYRRLRKLFKSTKGILMENKGYTISVHYRNINDRDEFIVKEKIKEFVKQYKNSFKFNHGKKVFEILPKINVNKGTAVRKIVRYFTKKLNLKIPYSIYIGDDTTDENVFKIIKRCGIGIRVGRINNSYASYYLNGTGEVRKLLSLIETQN